MTPVPSPRKSAAVAAARDVDGPWRIQKLSLRARTPYGPTDVTLRYFR